MAQVAGGNNGHAIHWRPLIRITHSQLAQARIMVKLGKARVFDPRPIQP